MGSYVSVRQAVIAAMLARVEPRWLEIEIVDGEERLTDGAPLDASMTLLVVASIVDRVDPAALVESVRKRGVEAFVDSRLGPLEPHVGAPRDESTAGLS